MTDLQDRILNSMSDGEPYSARELAESLDEPRRTVQYNLDRLAESGQIERKAHSQRNVTYWAE